METRSVFCRKGLLTDQRILNLVGFINQNIDHHPLICPSLLAGSCLKPLSHFFLLICFSCLSFLSTTSPIPNGWPRTRMLRPFSKTLTHIKVAMLQCVMSISLTVCVFSGAIKLWLEQEGEAQLCSKCCGLHSQVQPGKMHTSFYTI